ncbi:hypothetical protein FA15DRAFT_752087 [Coprinopsis marcescibilis]|uniref:Protein transport protein sec16 n=1 Tax=Coprinopsis marcescibilis TaxID=230819 RepID=A0A5C3LBY8_COPMA|nr:hypothetical protein FA15DRAFT_752087 [Coprinopsis marcescibilis]
MSVPEAAASLFGSEEESADPFAVIGSNATQVNADAPNLFPNDQSSDFLASTQEAHATQPQSQFDPAGYPAYQTAETNASWSQTDVVNEVYQGYSAAGATTGAHYQQATSYSSTHAGTGSAAPQSTYNPSAYLPAAPAPAPPAPASNSNTWSSANSTNVDRYAPSTAPKQPAYQYDYTQPTANTYSQPTANAYSQPTANAYSQPTTNTYSQPTANAYSQPTANAYSQSTTSTYSQYTAPAYPAQPTLVAAPPVGITPPAPPAPKVPITRPKVSNAYDPPFPTTKARRTGRTQAPANTYGVYGGYQPAQQQPPLSPVYATNQFAGQQAHQPPPVAGYSQYSTPPPPAVQRVGPPTRSVSYGNVPNSHSVPQAPVQSQAPPPPAARKMNIGEHRVSTPESRPYAYPHQSPPGPPPARRPTAGGAEHIAPPDPHQNGPIYGSERALSPPQPAEADFFDAQALNREPQHPEAQRQDPDVLNGGPSPELQDPYAHPSTTETVPEAQASESVASEEGFFATGFGAVNGTDVVDHMESNEDPQHYSYPSVPQLPTEPQALRNEFSSPPPPTNFANSPPMNHSRSYSIEKPPSVYEPYAPNRPATLPQRPVSDVQQRTYSPVPEQKTQFSSPPPPSQAAPYDPYAPNTRPTGPTQLPTSVQQRTASPAPSHQFSPPRPPANPIYSPPQTHTRSFNEKPTGVYDPYAPNRSMSLSQQPPIAQARPTDNAPQTYGSTYEPQLLAAAAPLVSKAYAPSPSLVGANDPLARVSARAPIISFGFGGRFVTCFHGAASLSTGFDVALASKNTTAVKLYTLKKLLPQSALSVSEAEYPGPLFGDPGAHSIGLVRSTAAAQAKTKKPRVAQYLEARATEISQGLGYLNPSDRQTAEAKLVLIGLLKIMVENDGKLSGSPSIDSAVRAVLVPRLSSEPAADAAAVPGFSAVGMVDAGESSLYSGRVETTTFEQPISVTNLRPSSLNKIEEYLIRGERKLAYTYALDQRLWAHAMVIASSIDKEAWKDVVNEFIQTELGNFDQGPHSSAPLGVGNPSQRTTSGRDSLRVAYRFFSGQGPTAVQELIPKQSLSKPNALIPPSASLTLQTGVTPRTPAFPPSNFAAPPPDSLSKWREAIAMMIASPPNAEVFAALSALGDQLLSYNWTEAAHVCYLLALPPAPLPPGLGGSGSPNARITLLGSRIPHLTPLFSRNPDNFILTEILEFALSLAPVAKGQESFTGVPHLQPYRLLHAASLAELGYIQEAHNYLEAITAALARGSPYFTPTFIHQLKVLEDRISGVAHSDKSSSWIGGKISKPTINSIGGWLDRRFTELVAGEPETSPAKENGPAEQRPFDGPFNHYSTISTVPSARTSPQPQQQVFKNNYAPVQRTSSAMAISSPYQNHAPIDRAASAIDYLKHNKPGRQSPAPPVPPMPAYASQRGAGLGVNTTQAPFNPAPNSYTPSQSTPTEGEMETPVQPPQASSWWDYSSNEQTPTAENEPGPEPSGEFISLMDSQGFEYAPAPAPARAVPAPSQNRNEEEDAEDLGFGNSKKSEADEGNAEAKKQQPAAASSKPELGSDKKQDGAGGGWLSRWFKASNSNESPGPIKASLGEENSFYYDKDQKRWVNKRNGPEPPKPEPGPPPPPSRAQTASPSKAAMRPSPLGNNAPPTRSTSAMDFQGPTGGGSAPPPPSRVRSNLVPASDAAPPPPMGGSRPSSAASMTGPPSTHSGPPSRPRSQATKKNLRSRYVDVFSQEQGGSS